MWWQKTTGHPSLSKTTFSPFSLKKNRQKKFKTSLFWMFQSVWWDQTFYLRCLNSWKFSTVDFTVFENLLKSLINEFQEKRNWNNLNFRPKTNLKNETIFGGFQTRFSRYKMGLTIWFLSSVGWVVISRHVSLLYFLVSNTTCLQPRLSQAFQDWWRPSNRSAISWVSIFTTKSILRHLSPGICICTSVQKYFILIFAPKMARLKSISVYFWRKNSKIQFLPIKWR